MFLYSLLTHSHPLNQVFISSSNKWSQIQMMKSVLSFVHHNTPPPPQRGQKVECQSMSDLPQHSLEVSCHRMREERRLLDGQSLFISTSSKIRF